MQLDDTNLLVKLVTLMNLNTRPVHSADQLIITQTSLQCHMLVSVNIREFVKVQTWKKETKIQLSLPVVTTPK